MKKELLIVPAEPTDEMMGAGVDVLRSNKWTDSDAIQWHENLGASGQLSRLPDLATEIYMAMVGASLSVL